MTATFLLNENVVTVILLLNSI